MSIKTTHILIAHIKYKNRCIVYVVDPIIAGVSRVVSRDNSKVIECHVNIDIKYIDESAEEW